MLKINKCYGKMKKNKPHRIREFWSSRGEDGDHGAWVGVI